MPCWGWLVFLDLDVMWEVPLSPARNASKTFGNRINPQKFAFNMLAFIIWAGDPTQKCAWRPSRTRAQMVSLSLLNKNRKNKASLRKLPVMFTTFTNTLFTYLMCCHPSFTLLSKPERPSESGSCAVMHFTPYNYQKLLMVNINWCLFFCSVSS